MNIVTVYRRPTHTPEEDMKLYSTLQDIVDKGETIITGDFNLPTVCWGTVTGRRNEDIIMTDFIKNNFLYQCVTEPTRERNILDLVITSNDEMISNLSVGEHLASSDHNLIRFSINVTPNECSSITMIPDYKNADFIGLKNSLNTLAEQVERINDVQDKWTEFKSIFMVAQNKYIPMKCKQKNARNKPPWFNTDINRAIKERNRLHTLRKRNNSEIISRQYISSRRNVKKQIRTAKRQYEINIAKAATTDPKLFYGYVNGNKRIKTGVGPLTDPQGTPVIDDKEIATTLNNFFSSVFTIDNKTTTEEQITNHNALIDMHISYNDVKVKLNQMNSNKTPGPDNFHPKILKNVVDEICGPLTSIFNKSLQEGKVPEDWKLANVTPIFKKGSRDQPGNYRPISLTSVLGKILESLIRDKITEFLENNNLISNTQHGFRSRKSCLTNLIEFYDNLFKANDNIRSIDIIYLDFQKAFDKVPHSKLLAKIKSLGIDGNIHRWISCWLNERKQRVVINGVESDWAPVTSGVPQGSVLGPLLFIMYINDIDVGLNNFISKFADDTKIGNAILTEEDKNSLQNDLNKIIAWSEKWQMPFNVNKCQVLQCGSKNKGYDYEMQGHAINKSSVVKDLGILISDDLKLSSQCISAANKANRILGFIKRNFTYKSKDIIIPLYKSLVRPHLEFAVQFWAPYLVKDINTLEAIQHRATKLIPSLRNKPYLERIKELDLFSLSKRRLRGKLIECFKTLKGFNNIDASKLFTVITESKTRGNGIKLQGTTAKLDSTKNFFTFSVISEWNKLPENVVESSSINMFKRRLDKYLEATGIV